MKRRGSFEDKVERKVRRSEEPSNNFLDVTPIHRLATESLPYFRRPAEIGHFSLDIDRKFHDDNHQLKYLCLPHTIKFDLTVGYKDFIARDEDVKEKLDQLLMWVDKHRKKFELSKKESVANGQGASSSNPSTSLNTDFITWRGHLTKLLITPYETREPWKMAATLYEGTIYLSEVETSEAYERRRNMEEKYKEMCYWGHKFEGYVCSLVSEKQKKRSEASSILDNPNGASSTASTSGESKNDAPCNNCEGFISVVRTRLENHSLVFGAEVDCCTDENEKSPENYIELKTSNHPHKQHQHWSFERYKLLKWWAQSYLAGVPKIICGFRHHHGIVNELQTYNTLEIPNIVRSRYQDNMWDMNICLNFLKNFLDWVKKVVVKDDAQKVYLFSFESPFNQVSVVESSNEEDCFLPEWYTKQM